MAPRKRPIFILGISRTGSKFYMNALNSHPDIFIAPELVFQHPAKACLLRDLRAFLSGAPSVSEIYDFVVSKSYKDTYVQTVSCTDRQGFVDYLDSLDGITELDIFYAILLFSSGGRTHIGAKFPVYYSFGEKLLSYFPDCQVVYLTRDPRDVYCSDLIMKTRRFEGSKFLSFARILVSPALMFYTICKWKRSHGLFDEWQAVFGSDRIKLFRFEDIARDRDGVLTSLAEFLDIDRSHLSLENVPVVDSSFLTSPGESRWESRLSPIELLFFKVFSGQSMASKGYIK